MTRIFCLSLFFGFGIAGMAQQLPTAPADPAQADSVPRDRQMDSPSVAESARSFNGTIVRAGKQFALKESSTRTLYRLDDQKKAKQYDGKRVRVTATMDSTNTLRVIDIIPSHQLPPLK
jgi:hypothetical protein